MVVRLQLSIHLEIRGQPHDTGHSCGQWCDKQVWNFAVSFTFSQGDCIRLALDHFVRTSSHPTLTSAARNHVSSGGWGRRKLVPGCVWLGLRTQATLWVAFLNRVAGCTGNEGRLPPDAKQRVQNTSAHVRNDI